MADPIRISYNWPSLGSRAGYPKVTASLIVHNDSLRHAAYLIAKHELSIWFEPRWQDARILARRFPHCAICSIHVESDTGSLRRIPGWRPRRNLGTV